MIEKLACSLGRNDERPNIELAEELVKTADRNGIREIVKGLRSATVATANDCIKVLYEIGERNPALIAEYAGEFTGLLSSRNNRMVWGAMTALATIAPLNPSAVFADIDKVIHAYEKGSVITVDNSISVFAGLARAEPAAAVKLFPIIISHLTTCRPKEVAQHAERAFSCINAGNSPTYAAVLHKRRPTLSAPQQKRVDRLLKKIEQGKFTG